MKDIEAIIGNLLEDYDLLTYDKEPESVETTKIANDIAVVIDLLKEMEPIAPLICGSKDDVNGFWWYMCGKCKMPICPKERFCRRCGQAVKWND